MESLQKKYSTTEIIGGVVSKEIIQVEKKKKIVRLLKDTCYFATRLKKQNKE